MLRCYEFDHNSKICNASKKIEIGKYVHLDLLMTTSAAELLASDSYSEVLSVKMGLFRAMEDSPTTMTIDEVRIRNTVFVDQTASFPLVRETPTEDNGTRADEASAE